METKIDAKVEGETIKVKAEYFSGEKKVHEINTAFPLDTEASVIKAAVEKAGNLFELEKKQAKEQEKVDKIYKKAEETINQLNG